MLLPPATTSGMCRKERKGKTAPFGAEPSYILGCHNKWMMYRIRRRLRQMSRCLGWPVWTWCRWRRPHGTLPSTCLLSGTSIPLHLLHHSCVSPIGQVKSKDKKSKDCTFWPLLDEKPGNIPSCSRPGMVWGGVGWGGMAWDGMV